VPATPANTTPPHELTADHLRFVAAARVIAVTPAHAPAAAARTRRDGRAFSDGRPVVAAHGFCHLRIIAAGHGRDRGGRPMLGTNTLPFGAAGDVGSPKAAPMPAAHDLAEDGPSAVTYRAFLSYSHLDDTAARRLHRRLESYRLPRRLAAGRPGGSRALGPIFRDLEDLPAATDLSDAVKRALARSAAMIVLCSPAARASHWVAREIALFRTLYPDRPILAAIVSGTPAEAFPEALTGLVEPLAADLRPEGDGRRLGLLKIVAGLAQVPLDALVQRDAQRRVRRVTAITLAALAMMLAMAVMTIAAITARNDAVRQKAAAEGLVEFMLTDLRPQLRQVGRLDVMTSVNERAMRYYAAQGGLDALDDAGLERRARILHAMGEDDQNRDRFPQALAKFREAYRVTAEQLRRLPGDPDRLFTHAQSAYWVGYSAYLAHDWPVAARHWQEYRDLAARLVAIDGRNPKWLHEQGYAEGNLCTLDLAQPARRTAALDHCVAALDATARAARLEPATTKAAEDLANRHAWIADAWFARGDTVRGFAERRRQLALLAPFAAREADNMELQDQWMRALMSLSEDLRDHGRTAEARPYHTRARALAAQLLSRDPDNERWRGWSRRIDAFDVK